LLHLDLNLQDEGQEVITAPSTIASQRFRDIACPSRTVVAGVMMTIEVPVGDCPTAMTVASNTHATTARFILSEPFKNHC
jgi:hypothetical protein